ncbi:MAG: metallophosphoesterase [Chthonomonadales bacterium]|nr:metallophosphoesterase [Chthonomonadales bacterium]
MGEGRMAPRARTAEPRPEHAAASAREVERGVVSTESGLEGSLHEVWLPGLARELDGARIAQVSDLHRAGARFDRVIEEAFRHANRLDPDWTLLTGDFVDRRRRDIEPVAKMAAGLRARRGILAVLGNHDYYAGGVGVARALERQGIEVLVNRALQAAPGLWFAGVDDWLEGRPDLDAALADAPPGAALVLMSHHPGTLDRLPARRPALVLSGHTHGGQYRVPLVPRWLICRLHLRTRFVEGWYRRGPALLYVNRGVGAAGGPILGHRLRCPPEVSAFTLRRYGSSEMADQ